MGADGFQHFVVQRYAVDDENRLDKASSEKKSMSEEVESLSMATATTVALDIKAVNPIPADHQQDSCGDAPVLDMAKRLSCKWTSGFGPRIGCVREYPTELQFRALEQVKLSPTSQSHVANCGPIPSPRPSPKIRVSPRLSYMGLPSPRVSLPN